MSIRMQSKQRERWDLALGTGGGDWSQPWWPIQGQQGGHRAGSLGGPPVTPGLGYKAAPACPLPCRPGPAELSHGKS